MADLIIHRGEVKAQIVHCTLYKKPFNTKGAIAIDLLIWCTKCARDLSTERGCNVFTLIVRIISTLCKFCSMCKRPFNRWGARVIYFAQIVTFFRMYTIFAHIVQGTSQQGRVRCCSHCTKYLHMLCKGPFNREGAMVVYLHTLAHCS